MILQVECLELEGLQMEKCHIALFLSDLRRCALLPASEVKSSSQSHCASCCTDSDGACPVSSVA